MKFRILVLLLLILGITAISFNLNALSITASTTGNWYTSGTWTGGTANRTGTITTSTSSTTLTGSGTAFLTELSVGSIVTTTTNTLIGTIASISNNTSATFTTNAASTNSGVNYRAPIPAAVDAVTINQGITVTVNMSASCASLTFATISNSNSVLTISGTNTLTVSGSVSMPRPSSGETCTINVDAGTMTVGTTLTMSATTTARNDIINVTTGTLTVSGNITSGTTGCIFNLSNTGTMNFGGTFSSTPTLTTATGSTVHYNGSGAQTIRGVTYSNLTLSGSGAKTITGATVNGVFLLEGTATTSGTVLAYGGSSSLRYNGSGVQTVGIEWPSTFARPITVSNANGVTLNASKAAYSGTLTNNGKLNSGNYQLTGTISNNGIISADRTDIMSSGTLTNNIGSTIDYTTALNIPASTGYYNLTLSASGTYYLTGNVTGINILTLTTGTTYLQTAGFNLGYVTLAGLGSILTPSTTLASTNPAVAAASIQTGSAKNPVYKFTLNPNIGLNFTGLSFTTTGSYAAEDIDNFKLWTYTSDAFASATQVGTTLSTGLGIGSHSFASFTQALTAGETRYFWITSDLDVAATIGNSIAVNALTTGSITVSAGTKTGTAYAGGTQTIVFVSLTSDYFRSNATGYWATPETWQSSHDGTNWSTATLSPTNAANTTSIRNGHTVTVAANVSSDQTTVDAGGQINISSGITLTIANGTGTDMTVNGTLRNNAGTITTTGTLAFGSGSLYQSNFTTTVGLIPTATWNATSTCEVIGYTTFSGTQTGLGQTFGNFTWNCPAQVANISAEEALDNIAGNFTIAATGNGQFRLGNATSTTNVGGNLLISGGILNMSYGNTLTINLTGNYRMTGGTLTESGYGAGAINFVGTTSQLITITGSPTISNMINFAVNSGAIIEFASESTVLSGSSGTFTANSGSTLIIKHAGGIASTGATGCVQTTGTRILNAAANYTYSGSEAQVTGTGRTGAANLTINNTVGVTLSAAITITGACTINTGAALATNNYNVAFGGNFTNNGTFTAGSSAITIQGTATQSIAGFTATGTVSMTKTGGIATLVNNVSGGALTINGSGGTLNLGTGLTHTFTGTWTRTNGTLNGGSSTLRLGSGFSGTGGTFTANTGTVEYYAAGAQTIARVTYNNLTFSGGGAKNATGAYTVNGILTLEGTSTTTGTAPSYGASSSLRY